MKVFDRPGPVNTDETIDIIERVAARFRYIVAASITGDCAVRVADCIKKAKSLSQKSLALDSSNSKSPHPSPLPEGEGTFGTKVICVTCPQGMGWEIGNMQKGPFADIPELKKIRDRWVAEGLKRVPMNITPENRAKLDKLDVSIVQGTIPFFGPSFSMRLHLGQITSLDILAKTLELISTGTLVALECVLMAVDAGVLPEDEQVLAVAGTERGLDTAWVIRSCASANLFHPTKGARFVELLAKPGISVQPEMEIEYLR
jgi:uncharacterized protein